MRGTALQTHSNPSPNYQSIFLRQFLTAQQLTELNTKLLRKEVGLLILEKLKKQLYANVEEEQFNNYVKNDAIHVMCHLLYDLIIECQRISEDIINPIIEQKYRYQKLSFQFKKQLEDYMEQNQVLKSMVDSLQQEKNQILGSYNNEVAQFQKSKEDVEQQIQQKLHIKHKIQQISQDVLVIFDQNQILKRQIQAYEAQIAILNNAKQQMKKLNQDLKQNRDTFYIKYFDANQQCQAFRSQNQLLKLHLQQKQQFISSFINQYNQAHIFNQESKYNNVNWSRTPRDRDRDGQDQDQLNQYHFNQYDHKSFNSSKSLQSLSKQNSEKAFEKVDEEGGGGNATAEKKVSKAVLYNNCITDEKMKNKLLIPTSKTKNSKPSDKEKDNQKKKQWRYSYNQKAKNNKLNNNNKTIIRTVSSKNINQSSQQHMTPASQHSSKIMQDALIKKLNEKLQKIAQLQLKNTRLIQSLMQQRQSKTNLEGQYELVVEQLKSQIEYHKTQYSELYKNHLNIKLDYQHSQQQIQELQVFILELKQSQRQYCRQLRSKCKAYLIQKLDEAQVICSKHRSSHNYHQVSIQNSFQLSPAPADRQDKEIHQSSNILQDELKNIESYSSGQLKYSKQGSKLSDNIKQQMLLIEEQQEQMQRYSNLTFSIKFSNLNSLPNNQIYQRHNYQVKSDSNFTDERDEDRFIHNQYVVSRGNFTDRQMANKNVKYLQFAHVSHYKSKCLGLRSQVVSQHIAGWQIQHYLQYGKCCEVIVLPNGRKKLQIVGMTGQTYQSIQHISSLAISQEVELMHIPNIKQLKLSLCSQELSQILIPQQIIPRKLNIHSHIINFNQHVQKHQESPIQQIDTMQLQCFNLAQTSPYIDCNHQKNHSQTINRQQQILQIQTIYICRQPQRQTAQQKLCLSISIIPQSSNQSHSICKSQDMSIICQKQHQLIPNNKGNRGNKDNKGNKDNNGNKNKEDKALRQVEKHDKIKSNMNVVSSNQEIGHKNSKDHNIGSFPLFMVKSQSNINKYGLQNKQNTKSNNPETKQIRNKLPLQEVLVSDWLMSDILINQPQQVSLPSPHHSIPSQLVTILPPPQIAILKSYLSKHKISLLYSETSRSPFKKPRSICQKVYLLNISSEQFILISQCKILNLLHNTSLETNKEYYIDDNNFKFGNSEVVIRSDQYLVINRKNKKNMLLGNMEDGSWFINYYISLEVVNN